MRVIAFKTIREFYRKHPESESALRAWFKEAENVSWKTPNEIKQMYPNASILAGDRIVLNIKGNKYRLIVKFNYKYSWAWIRFIGTHAEYDKINAENI